MAIPVQIPKWLSQCCGPGLIPKRIVFACSLVSFVYFGEIDMCPPIQVLSLPRCPGFPFAYVACRAAQGLAAALRFGGSGVDAGSASRAEVREFLTPCARRGAQMEGCRLVGKGVGYRGEVQLVSRIIIMEDL